MKVLISLSISLILFCYSINSYAVEFEFVAKDNSKTTQICMSAVTDNTDVMVKKLKKLSRSGTVLSYRSIVNSIKCNNQYVGNFAKKYDAQNTFAYLDKYTNRSNKKRQSNITIKDIAYEQGKYKETTLVLLVGSK